MPGAAGPEKPPTTFDRRTIDRKRAISCPSGCSQVAHRAKRELRVAASVGKCFLFVSLLGPMLHETSRGHQLPAACNGAQPSTHWQATAQQRERTSFSC